MGTAWEVLLWPFEISFTASMAAGIGALLALERQDGRGDALACALLVFSLAFSELALSFALGAAVSMILARRKWSRAYVVAIPLVLYAAWSRLGAHGREPHLGAQPGSQSEICRRRSRLQRGSLLGVPNVASIWVGRPLLVLLVVAIVLRVRSRRLLPPSLWSALAILLSFWFLDAIAVTAGRGPNTSRYQYVGAFLLLMVLAELAGGIRLRRPVVRAALGIAGLAVIANLLVLRHSYGQMSDWATRARGAMAAFEVGGSSADANFTTGPDNTDIVSLNSLRSVRICRPSIRSAHRHTAHRSWRPHRRTPALLPTSCSPTRRACTWCQSIAHLSRAVRRPRSPLGPARQLLRTEAA